MAINNIKIKKRLLIKYLNYYPSLSESDISAISHCFFSSTKYMADCLFSDSDLLLLPIDPSSGSGPER